MNAQDPIRVQILQETLEQLKKEQGSDHAKSEEELKEQALIRVTEKFLRLRDD